MFSCKNFTDDTSSTLYYKFTYDKPNGNGGTTETLLKDFNQISEQLSTFVFFPSSQDEVTFTGHCYCQDIYGATTKISQKFKIIKQTEQSAIPINALLAGTDFGDSTLTAFQNSNRAEVLKSLAQDLNKDDAIVNMATRTFIYPNGTSPMLTMIDPNVTDSYCNNRGKANLVDKFLVCTCEPKYIGVYCQLFKSDYESLYDKYSIILLLIFKERHLIR